MLNVKIQKDDMHYVMEYFTNASKQVTTHSVKSLHDALYTLGRLVHLNNVHFHIPTELTNTLVNFLKVEFPGELYEHNVTVYRS